MKTTRFAALALAMTMALGTLTGCSGKDSSSAADTGNTLRIGAIAPLTGEMCIRDRVFSYRNTEIGRRKGGKFLPNPLQKPGKHATIKMALNTTNS